MPPRKVTGSPKNVAEKKTRRQKIVKPVLKTPSLVKVKLKLPTATVNNDDNVGSEVTTSIDAEEVKKPEIKKDTIVTRKYVRKKIGTNGQNTTCDAPLRRKRQVKPVSKNYKTFETSVAVKQNTKSDIHIPQVDANYYKILLANDVVKMQFPSKTKFDNENPLEHVLHDNKTIVKKKMVCDKNSLLKKKVIRYSLKPDIKTTVRNKKCERSNAQVSRTITPHVSECKHDVTSNKADVITPKQAEQVTKRRRIPKDITEKISFVENHCIANSTSKVDVDSMVDTKDTKPGNKRKRKTLRRNVKAGPLKRNLNCNNTKRKRYTGKALEDDIKDEVMVTDKSVENCNFDKCDDNSIEKVSVSSFISWTKDISSSSNSSLVTIHSNGLHCFGNKIPVVQLNYINQKSRNNDGTNEISECVVSDYCDSNGNVNMTDKHHSPSTNLKRRLSRSSSSSLDRSKLNFCPEQDRINKCTVIEDNIGDITHASLRLSTSSISSNSSSSSTSTSSSSTSSSSNITSKKDLDNKLISDKMLEDKLEVEKKTSESTKFEFIAVLQKLNLNLKKCDFDTIKLSKTTYEKTNNKENVRNMQDKLFKNDVLKEETALCNLCYNITQLEIDDVDKYFNHSEHQDFDHSEQLRETTNNPCPKTPETYYSKDSQLLNEHVDRNAECGKETYESHKQFAKKVDAIEANELEEKIDSNSFLACNKSNPNSFCDNDDDDALSLFAESLTGLESCRKNSTFNADVSESEEYVPQPVVAKADEPRTLISYQPTKIANANEEKIRKYTMMCKKQKADSTCLLIDSGNNPNTQENIIYEDRIGNFSQNLAESPNTVTKSTPVANKPRLMSLNYRSTHGLKSLVFKGYCFFYIISNCKKHKCKFPHEYPNVDDVKNTLQRLSEESFIQEYMLVRCWPQLRRNYGLCFLEECTRRELTRIVVEIALDFIVKTNQNLIEDNAVKAEVIDNVLMYLNQVDLSSCDDLLEYNIKYFDKVLLCDYFMSVIATSQNFSRFKPVFINLTDFMYVNGRRFSIEVAESILERFCILPFDDLLAQALLKILKNTDVTVFSNAKMSDLERKFQDSNNELYYELKLLKDQALVRQPVLDNNHYEPLQSMDAGVKRNFGHTDINIVRYSPDTTDLNNANITPMKTTFKRTVNIDNLKKLGLGNNTNMQSKSSAQVKKSQMTWMKPDVLRVDEHSNTNSSNATENSMKNWKYRSIFDNQTFKRSFNTSPVWPQRTSFKRHSDRSFNDSPKTKFKWSSGPSNHY